MWSRINNIARRNKPLGFAAGGILGWFAWSRPFAAIASLGILSEWVRRKKEAQAMKAARLAAITTGKNDAACVADIHSAECAEHVKAVAIKAGQTAMGNAPVDDRDVERPLWRFAGRFVVILIAIFAVTYFIGVLTR